MGNMIKHLWIWWYLTVSYGILRYLQLLNIPTLIGVKFQPPYHGIAPGQPAITRFMRKEFWNLPQNLTSMAQMIIANCMGSSRMQHSRQTTLVWRQFQPFEFTENICSSKSLSGVSSCFGLFPGSLLRHPVFTIQIWSKDWLDCRLTGALESWRSKTWKGRDDQGPKRPVMVSQNHSKCWSPLESTPK